MDNSKFQLFCYEEYKRILSSADDTYRRYPLALTAIVIIATATIALGTDQYFPQFLVRVDVTLFYVGLGVALGGTALSTVLLMVSIFPKDYEHLDSPLAFYQWREAYRKDLLDKGYKPDVVEETVAMQTHAALTLRLVEATDKNIKTDRARMRWYNRAIYAIGVAVIALGTGAAFYWVITYKGIT